MKPNIKIAQNVVDRLKSVQGECCGRLFGTFHKDSHIILGLYQLDPLDIGDLYFPADVDMCGAYQVGPLNQAEITKLLTEIDVTDNPVLISVIDESVIAAYYLINNQLEATSMKIVQEADLYNDYIHTRIKAQLPMRAELTVNAIKEELLSLRKQFSSGKIGFHCQKEDVFVLGSNEKCVTGPEDVTEEMTIGKLIDKHNEMVEEKYSRRSDHFELDVMSVVMYKKASFDNTELDGLHAPLIHVEKNSCRTLQLLLNVDALSLVHKETTLGNLYTILVESACRNLRHIGNFVTEYVSREDGNISEDFEPEVVHYYPHKCGHFVTRILNRYTSDAEEIIRRRLHQNFLIPSTKPYFRRANRFIFNGDVHGKKTIQLKNVHKEAKPSNNGGEQALVKGDYLYYHYLQDNMDDDGWGCAYRSLQTLASWFKLQGYTDAEVPTFKEIQKCLYDIGDKPANFVGSRQWIGSTEVNFVLNTVMGVTSKILYVSSGEEMSTKGPELLDHFNRQGTPIMIGGGVLAHTILGVDYNRDTTEIKFLILDPHYTGREDIKVIISKGWCGWKGINFWDKKSYYNMCMPIVPKCI